MNLWDLIDMSKLVDAVEAVTDNRRRYKPEKLFAQLVDVKAEFDKDFLFPTRLDTRSELRLELQLGSMMVVPPHSNVQLSRPNDLS